MYEGELGVLWRQAVAHPDDDGLRGVLADALQAAGDPRGELMGLQLLTGEDSQVLARQQQIQALLRAHQQAWLGELHPILDGACFDRGFLTRVTPRVNDLRDKPSPRVLGSPELATVHELVFPQSFSYSDLRPRQLYEHWLRHARLPALRAIELHTADLLPPDLVPETLEHVVLHGLGGGGSAVTERVEALFEDRPALRSAAVELESIPVLGSSSIAKQLVTLVVAPSLREGLSLWSTLGLTTLVVGPRIGLSPCTIAYPYDYRVELARTADGVIAKLSGEWLMTPMSLLDALPRDLARVEIEYASDPIASRLAGAVPPNVPVVLRRTKRAGNLNLKRGAS